jgi:UDP-N-acetylglucosamine--N-acetylmuramyl-(pentapeptide) pyrophosphoryl-undecaprenol N-acetylglucosamine transferase
MRVQIFMCGEGLGHTSRCLALGAELKSAGHEVSYGAYGYSKDLVEKSGYRADEIPSEIKLVGKAGSLDMKGSVEATVKNANLLGGSLVVKLIEKTKPDVIVSDGYYLAIFAGKAKGVPVHAIANQTNMEEFFRNKGVPLQILGGLAKGLYTTVYENVESIIVPDYPPPYTVCRHNLVFTPNMAKRVIYAGPMVRRRYAEVRAQKAKKPFVLSMVGGFGYREAIFKSILESARDDPGVNYTLVSGPNVDMAKYGRLPRNVETLKFIEDPFPYIKASDAMIAPGGHSTMMEAMAFGKPLLSIPDMFHNEQENNAQALEESGFGKRLSYFSPPEVILECIREVLQDRTYAGKVGRLRRLAQRLDGPKRVRLLLES